jgi:hypothetical protein
LLQILGQKDQLRRAGARRHVAVEGDDVPCAEVVTIEPRAHRARQIAEVRVIGRPVVAVGLVLVIAGARFGPVLVPPPARVVAIVVVGRRSVRIRVVAGREQHVVLEAVEQLRGVFRMLTLAPVVAGAVGDVAGSHERPGRGRWRGGRRGRGAWRRRGCGRRRRGRGMVAARENQRQTRGKRAGLHTSAHTRSDGIPPFPSVHASA